MLIVPLLTVNLHGVPSSAGHHALGNHLSGRDGNGDDRASPAFGGVGATWGISIHFPHLEASIDFHRARLNLSSLHAVPLFHSGSPYFSNASAAPISCLPLGYTQNH